MIWRALLVWLGLLLIAVLNGALREAVLIPVGGERSGHVVSTLMLCAAIAAAVYLTIPWIRPERAAEAFLIGLAWLTLTLAFELGFGRARGRPWAELLADYDILHGRIWVLVLIVTALAPLVAARARSLFSSSLIP
jgi:hypothetical protein